MRQNVFDTLQQEAVSSEDNVFAQFLQTKGLYDHIEITEKNISELCDLIGGKVKLNLYCKICEETRVFSMQATTFLFPVDDDKKEIRSLAKELMWNQRFQTMKDTPRPGENQEVREWYWSNWQTQDATRVMVFPFVCAMDDTHHIDSTAAGWHPVIAECMSLSPMRCAMRWQHRLLSSSVVKPKAKSRWTVFRAYSRP